MDMYQKRKIRAEKKNNDSQKSFSKVPISWFPGHMAKTRRQITEDLKMIDVVVEILDARIPNSSQNPDIRQITQNKKKIIILNKYDLADNAKTEKWIEYFNKKERKVVLADSLTGKGVNETTRQIQKIMEDEMQ
ncbi:MAG: ribosome biogenesis GTPase YlqF, partial [Clostridia bacterium]|nr:ribosome biogenesis GTPase YlqF [Clostridia bacterium]